MGKGSKKQHGLLENLRKRISPAIEGLGYELYDLEELLSEGKRILRVSIDQEQGIQIDDCIRVDQLLHSLLEDEDSVEGEYFL
ncbi:MAG: ribosome maturation factor, partial [SAR324 cluster bacterium]|nr:ribosome maturation factor [SAR324 cluster bacterium]